VSQTNDDPPEREFPLVLIVDDSDDIREMLRFVLLSSGYRVIEARNGREAVTLAIALRPDLILMDLSMPVLDGFAAARYLRSSEGLRSIPIVAVSAHSTHSDREEAFAIGFNDYLTKPIDFASLIGVVQSLIQAS
jgi:two-component system cell cycle response regulator DivK